MVEFHKVLCLQQTSIVTLHRAVVSMCEFLSGTQLTQCPLKTYTEPTTLNTSSTAVKTPTTPTSV